MIYPRGDAKLLTSVLDLSKAKTAFHNHKITFVKGLKKSALISRFGFYERVAAVLLVWCATNSCADK